MIGQSGKETPGKARAAEEAGKGFPLASKGRLAGVGRSGAERPLLKPVLAGTTEMGQLTYRKRDAIQ